MQHPRKRSRRLLVLAVVLALALMSVTTSLVSAANTQAQNSASPTASCLSVQPSYQEVGASQTATLRIALSLCPLPPITEGTIVAIWGDGSSSTYPLCTGICPGLPYNFASHIYKLVGDYHPQICLETPQPITSAEDCTSVEIVVFPVATPLT